MKSQKTSTSDNIQTLPFGSWPSPVTAAMVAGKSLRLGQPRIEGDRIYWLEMRPHEGGRTALVAWDPDKGCNDCLSAEFSVQSRAHGYGGGAFTVHGNVAWFVNRNDQCIYMLHEQVARPLTRAEGPPRYFADLVYDASRNRLLAVCETHQSSGKVDTSIVAVDCSDGHVTELLSGNDFYSSPRISPDGRRLAWLAWSFPDMPWDATELFVASFDTDGNLQSPISIGGNGRSLLQPLWRNNEELLFASDESDWWNLHAWRDGEEVRNLHAMDAEFAVPHWVFGSQTFGLLDEDILACAYTQNGTWRLAELNLLNGEWRQHELPYSQIDHVYAANGHVVLQAAAADRSSSILLLDHGNVQLLRTSAEVDLDPELLAPPEPFTFETGDGEQAHGLYYAPANPACVGPASEAPPLLVKVHGGPTSATSSALDMKIRFWTSRGFAVLDVNYRGSTGYGRKYRHSLYGRWGVADVEDAINGARALADRGLADPEKLLISGSSAGGLTVLAALTFHDVFAAGASYYGVGDIKGVMHDTEKFESRYGDRLIGPLPETEQTWHARSPLFHAERLDRPVIFFQGLEDRIVPPNQSERMYEAARSNGVDTFYIRFPDEGHGFRGARTIETALEAEYAFYCRVLRICASQDLPDLERLATESGSAV